MLWKLVFKIFKPNYTEKHVVKLTKLKIKGFMKQKQRKLTNQKYLKVLYIVHKWSKSIEI